MKIEVKLSEKEFIRFSMFDVLRRQKRWRAPAIFALILGVSAAACFVLHERRGAVVLGAVLLVLAAGLPAAYFLSFFLSVRSQAKKQGLSKGKYVYTLDLHDDGDGIDVDNGREHAAYSWEQVSRAYRGRDATYLYISAQRAFLIPHGCVEGGTQCLWQLLERRVSDIRQI